MGSWNSVCITLSTESPTNLADEVASFLDAEWNDVREPVNIPDEYTEHSTDLFAEYNLSLHDFDVKTRGNYVYCYYGGHDGSFGEYDEFFYVLLAHISKPDFALKLLQFEDGQGGGVLYEPDDDAEDWLLEHDSGTGSPEGYIQFDAFENWDDAYGAEHVALFFAREFGLDVGVAELGKMYVLDVNADYL